LVSSCHAIASDYTAAIISREREGRFAVYSQLMPFLSQKLS
jgi:hypothetical protein